MGQLFHAPPQPAETDERFTPRWVFDALEMTFDLDPASPLHHDTHVPARRKLTVEEDGLSASWHGLVWLNPPYSNATPWADRFIAHRNGLWLGPYANAAWLWRLIRAGDLVGISADFAFVHPEHKGRHTNLALMFVACGDEAVAGLLRLCRSGVHEVIPMVRVS